MPSDEKRVRTEAAEKHVQARALVELLEWRHYDHLLGMDRIRVDLKREPDVVRELFGLCGQEVYEAIAADATGRVFCSLWLIMDQASGKIRLGGNLGIVWKGIGRAIRDALRSKDRGVPALVRKGVAAELARRRDERIAVFKELPAREMLPRLLKGLRNGLHENMAIHMDHLTLGQRLELREALHEHLSDGPLICFRMDREPENPHEWLFWYLCHSDMQALVARGETEGVPLYCMVSRRGFVRSSKKGKAGVIFPLGPMFAHVYKALGREMSKHGHPIKDPGSVNRIARSLNVSQPTAAAWLKEDLPGLEITPDGNGGVSYTFNNSTVRRSMEIAKGKERGPQATRS